ncbi:hypothetical protein LIER_43082 [Lithospermum erythrorhizon]|uniref:Reverse transcriptase domain-containing protein n=1 Tax=Lithospermum erythrorhizon TaxID=34254 RepID=A0AAV3PEG3_LITER
MNFSSNWIAIIKECVTFVQYLVLTNRQVSDPFKPPCGLRHVTLSHIKNQFSLKCCFTSSKGLSQGDPISSYMFLLVLEVFNGLIKEACQEKDFLFHHQYELQCLTHLCFADDMMIDVKPTEETVRILIECLHKFGDITGLKLNCSKSRVFFGGFKGGGERKMSSWQSKRLSIGGRAQLIRTFVFGIQNFWCSNMPLPKYVIEEVEKKIRTFLWSGKSEGIYHSKVAWKTYIYLLRREAWGSNVCPPELRYVRVRCCGTFLV